MNKTGYDIALDKFQQHDMDMKVKSESKTEQHKSSLGEQLN